ncbi:putative F-box domain, galactose oxidase/kelch, beta-propeller, F-box associated interaction [Helianthus annuus]|nr:putative F-box domain, galactose oxidase/kelch, beta-propeller, F-box associated interaction [Helianthus annuus]KAJ0590519.1 putative F-box domain, galactose oxidase/kelch, beta-propeller, F-box associated interaction [Helianthus annuus]KAJ0758919.1 putative F-box domain, galactose oxidase/kelch, beta-propeller, F-box associated interaction [Helianthus annuus]KAJ0932797.1 putative F-box domain, galactose oxidase/kelch, beta-propeller, F-box associated interaction [Helianthus annuus]
MISKTLPHDRSFRPFSMSIFDLPEEIVFDILSRLPTKSLISFRCVCTSAPPLISHPSFIERHLSSAADADRTFIYGESLDNITHFYSLRSPATYQETLKLQSPYNSVHGGYRRVAGSNKGLICLFDTNEYSSVGTLILWNPSIDKFKIVDGPHNVLNAFSHYVLGFGFVSRTLEFKVVEIIYNSKTKNNTVLVYSLSTNSWEKKEHVSAPCYLTNWSDNVNVFVNGFVNWLVYFEATAGGSHSYVIMAFDLDNERFRLLDLPRNIVPDCYSEVSIASYGDASALSLSFCGKYYEQGVKFDVWVMGDYGLADSWKKVFVVSLFRLSIAPLLMKSEREVFIVMKGGRLMLLDAIENEVQDLNMRGAASFFRAISYTPSLALLHGQRRIYRRVNGIKHLQSSLLDYDPLS